MKKLLLLLAIMAFTTTSAFALDTRIGAYGIVINDFDNTAVDIDKPVGGIMASFDQGMFGADIYTVGKSAGVDVRANLTAANFVFSLGVGYQNTISGKVTDTDDLWDAQAINVKDSGVTNFLEVSHTSGMFIRATVSDYDATANFTRSHVDHHGMRVVDNTKTVTVSETLETIMIGYRHSF